MTEQEEVVADSPNKRARIEEGDNEPPRVIPKETLNCVMLGGSLPAHPYGTVDKTVTLCLIYISDEGYHGVVFVYITDNKLSEAEMDLILHSKMQIHSETPKREAQLFSFLFGNSDSDPEKMDSDGIRSLGIFNRALLKGYPEKIDRKEMGNTTVRCGGVGSPIYTFIFNEADL